VGLGPLRIDERVGGVSGNGHLGLLWGLQAAGSPVATGRG
jgi:hypothetical protein